MKPNACVPVSYPADVEPRLACMLETLAEEYPIFRNRPDVTQIRFASADDPRKARAIRTAEAIVIQHCSLAQAARMTGAVLAGLVEDEHEETFPFDRLGFIVCAAHGKVFTVAHIKKWLRRLAMLGFNQMVLYADDTFEVEGEPFFGYLRGRYSADEIRAIDDYASRLGVELVPAIQTLGHLSQLTQWPAYRNVQDTRSVVLVDEPRTYELIDKMIAFWKTNTHCSRIHLGMDEAHDMGRGVYMDRHGYRPAFDIFNRHLGRVVDICRRHSLAPMMWSDMYFRMGSPSKQDYYDPATVIPPDVGAAIPGDARLVYWDYYHEDKSFYVDWIARHRALHAEPVVASAIWTWSSLWHHADMTARAATQCIAACIETGVRELMLTTWGDDGSCCDFDSALLGFASCAEQAFAHDSFNELLLAKRFEALMGTSYDSHKTAAQISDTRLSTLCILWDNPLYHAYLHNARLLPDCDLAKEAQRLDDVCKRLADSPLDASAGDLWHARLIAQYLAVRLRFAVSLFSAWAGKDRRRLEELAQDSLDIAGATDGLANSFRSNWMACAKPFGLEVIQMRLAAISQGFRELSRRLQEYLEGTVSTLEELDANLHPPRGEFGAFKFSHVFTPWVDIRK